MPRKAKPANRNTFVKFALRRASLKWPPRNQAMRNARVERGKYKCAMCEEIFGPTEVQLDHIKPVVDIQEGFVDLNTYVERLLPYEDGWQCLCKSCHDIKTSIEDAMRSNQSEIENAKKLEAQRVEKEKKKMEKVLKKLAKSKESV